MHFFYLDESGCSGSDIVKNNAKEPIFVLGGISVRDEGWRKTYSLFHEAIVKFFRDNMPLGFELHASDLLSPAGSGFFEGVNRSDRNQFAIDILKLISKRGHAVHFVAFDKAKISSTATGLEHKAFNSRIPYLLGYNYLVSYTERYCKTKLGKSARGMIITDPKQQFDQDVQRLIHFRRYETNATSSLKWLVEFSYAIDSQRHPMIQMSDLVIFVIRKFLEIECGYRNNWTADAKKFYAQCYDIIQPLIAWKDIIPPSGNFEKPCHELIKKVRATHRSQWRRYYELNSDA